MFRHPQPLPPTRPFLKWAGGKTRLLPQLLPLLPLRARLVEPFVGAGSVFLAADYDSYLINDANPDLAAVWAALQVRPREFMQAASSLFTGENDNAQAYYRIREEFNATGDRFERAVRLPYLNRFGFNGLYRVNGKGEFNVPYGRRSSLPTFPWDEMAAASVKLQRCLVTSGGYAAAVEASGFGDVLYCDPPYLDSSTGDSFTAYTQARFALQDQVRLVELCRNAVERGATVLISNHDTPQTRELYAGFELHTARVRRSLAGSSDSRVDAAELIAILRPNYR